MDQETQKVIAEGEHFLNLVQSKGWALAKEQVITPALLDLQSVNNIKRSGPTDMAREVYARQIALEYVMAILKDIEGLAEKHVSNRALAEDPHKIIQNY